MLLMQMTGDVGAGDLYTLWSGAWDPHDPDRLVTSGGNGIQVHMLLLHNLSMRL